MARLSYIIIIIIIIMRIIITRENLAYERSRSGAKFLTRLRVYLLYTYVRAASSAALKFIVLS